MTVIARHGEERSENRIYTFNMRDFQRLAPDLASRIVAP